MKKFLKFRYGEKGFTLIELLIVVAILGILAVVVIPNVANMLRIADVAAANTEAAGVEVAAVAYLAEHNGHAPAGGWGLTGASKGVLDTYLSGELKADYDLDNGGMITNATVLAGGWEGITWYPDTHQWEKTRSG